MRASAAAHAAPAAPGRRARWRRAGRRSGRASRRTTAAAARAGSPAAPAGRAPARSRPVDAAAAGGAGGAALAERGGRRTGSRRRGLGRPGRVGRQVGGSSAPGTTGSPPARRCPRPRPPRRWGATAGRSALSDPVGHHHQVRLPGGAPVSRPRAGRRRPGRRRRTATPVRISTRSPSPATRASCRSSACDQQRRSPRGGRLRLHQPLTVRAAHPAVGHRGGDRVQAGAEPQRPQRPHPARPQQQGGRLGAQPVAALEQGDPPTGAGQRPGRGEPAEARADHHRGPHRLSRVARVAGRGGAPASRPGSRRPSASRPGPLRRVASVASASAARPASGPVPAYARAGGSTAR